MRQKSLGNYGLASVGNHMPKMVSNYRRCRKYSRKGQEKRSRYMCAEWDVPLCIATCFSRLFIWQIETSMTECHLQNTSLEHSHISEFGAATVGNSSRTRFLEVSFGGFPFLPEPLQLSCQVIYSQFGLAIHQNDHQARRRFVEWAQNEIAVVPDFHKRILFSDEAHFWLNGYVNKQNCRIWSEANPQVYVEKPLHPEKLTVWCALCAGGILLQKR
ncbi:uncharacterized protein TNCV_3109091 [Trichonephila clavipes]|nr:uncharacterized protein TNCV_3109091 [Trichonephila clavipes]